MKADKDLYRELRDLPPDRLWSEEVARFNAASPRERMQRVAVIRAIGVAFAGYGSAEQKGAVRDWLLQLLKDPNEKIRRYAAAALPKIGGGARAESGLLDLAKSPAGEREKRHIGRALDKIGGERTLQALRDGPLLPAQTEQKVRARVARLEETGAVRLDRMLTQFERLLINLRCRRGLEEILEDEVEGFIRTGAPFRLQAVRSGCVVLAPLAQFTLGDLYRLRCFGAVCFEIGFVPDLQPDAAIEEIARLIAAPRTQFLFRTFTEGASRYRLEIVGRGHQRGTVNAIANRAFDLCPDLLNDARLAPWAIDVHPTGRGTAVELRPRISPDPRWFYRRDDVPAASHPPLAACMARVAGRLDGEVVWDPFCGSGLELIERGLLGGVKTLIGTDLDPAAIPVAQANLLAAKLTGVAEELVCCDFRDHAKVRGLEAGRVTLVITNPPMGRRVRIQDMQALFADLFAAASHVLKPGGRLVFPNPIRLEPTDPTLRLELRQTVDLGGFDCRLEVYRKTDGAAQPRRAAHAVRPRREAPPAAREREEQTAAPPRRSAKPDGAARKKPFWHDVVHGRRR